MLATWLALASDAAWVAAQQPVAGSPSSDHARVRHTVDEVLARGEFADLKPQSSGWLREFLAWFFGLFDGLSLALWDLGYLFWVIIAWMVLTLLAILVHFLWTAYTLFSPSAMRSVEQRPGPEGGELLGIRDLDFDRVYARGLELLAAREFADATRYLYVAAILWLDRQGQIAFGPAKTNRDYVTELAKVPGVQAPFRQLTQQFEAIVYGGMPADATNSQEMASVVKSLVQ